MLGLSEVAAVPADMTVSIGAGCYTLADPGRVLDLQAELGEGSPWHVAHGIYLDPVNPHLPTLPEQWQSRLITLAREGVVAHFLEPHDAAVSKLARGEPRDLRWVLAGARGNILALSTVALRMKSTAFLDVAEQRTALALLDRLRRTLKPAARN